VKKPKQAMRTHIALGACLGSAGWGAFAIYHGASNITLIAFSIAAAWFLAAIWLSRRFCREKRLSKPKSSPLQGVMKSETPQMRPLVQVMRWGAAFLIVMGIAVLFVR
jgi:hypothetical protein